MGSFDPGCVMPKKAGVKRQPPAQVALDNYERDKKRREANASKTEKAAKGGKRFAGDRNAGANRINPGQSGA